MFSWLYRQAINDFLAQVWKAEEETLNGQYPTTHRFTVIHDLETKFWGATQELRGEEPNTILQSPFTNLSFPEIKNQLIQLNETIGSSLATNWFLVLDERSVETNSGVMVNVGSRSNHALRSNVRSLRVDYPTSSRDLAAVSIAHPSIDELKEVVDGNPEKFRGILRDD